ncbi:MAG: exodeoxyribonuclease VII small subunit [Candidatus Nephthysia bennettiae]|uniref:Exodeoxyribonuclease VII small subunit n=1 Tax=Candidatus Nephthysia bennettiae TaxID=3127016 RepID=A0A934NBI3_9BACT|nr:exodeoxyribonuclease VII small subunit [Candidatus Dormibacteraeota bacterium]MBJ7611174.1 exodeoxyribonuclease VII small subunit [Candidatus Dormibacteraeota bacterium]PZR90623.1 MAG: exodeoxyribonuclease VII small subunit [Candidatus Dormibacteraeota bacterium]
MRQAEAASGDDGGPSLDQLLESLEAVLQRLADPSAPLDRAVADYEQARQLLAAAEVRLEAARRRVALVEPGRD